MQISLKADHDSYTAYKVIDAIHENVRYSSRFKCDIELVGQRGIKIRNVRLKESKRYCGSHPFSCDIEGGRRGNYLEGADWAEFNDLINDILDTLQIDAYVRTSVCIIRKGRRRRTYYGGDWDRWGHPQWNKDEDDEHYVDYCGEKAPDSDFPEGTPGTYERNVHV